MSAVIPSRTWRGIGEFGFALHDHQPVGRIDSREMPSHKKLQSVSRSIADSFTSLMNYRGTDYVMGHLLKAARASGTGRLEVDLLSGTASPEALLVPPVAGSVYAYCRDFQSLVERSGSDITFVRKAVMSMEFDISISRPYANATHLMESPYTCVVAIEDDRGNMYPTELKGWWYPET